MKLKTTLIAVLSLACTAISQAFSINFDDVGEIYSNASTKVGQTITGTPLIISVVGYGDVTFTSSTVGGIVIGPRYTDNALEVNSIEFDNNGDRVTVTFPTEVVIFKTSNMGEDSNEDIETFGTLPGKVHDMVANLQVSALNPAGDGLGVQAIYFDVVPEPSSAALGALGMSMILLRRRRA